jgi:hypothetical protein
MPNRLGAQHWLAMEEEARAEAERMTDPAAKRLMTQIADNYAELAIAAGIRAAAAKDGPAKP